MDFITKLAEWENFEPDQSATDDERYELLSLAGERTNRDAHAGVWKRLLSVLVSHGGKSMNAKMAERAVWNARVSTILGAVPTDVMHLVELWVQTYGIVCRHNGMITSGQTTMVLDNGKVVEVTAADLADPAVKLRMALTRRDVTSMSLYNDIFLFTRKWPNLKRFTEAELKAAVGEWVSTARAARPAVLFREIDRQPDPTMAPMLTATLHAAIRSNFVVDDDFTVEFYEAAIKKFMHQVKCKMVGKPVDDHLMIVLLGKQGIGKTTLVRTICTPLLESMRTVKFDQIADQRYSMELSKSFILFVDEMAGAKKAEMNTVKTLITEDRADTRPLGKNEVISLEQKATLIGTSNDEMDQLIRDTTGNRRFVGLRMCDNPDWASLAAVDWTAVWSSVRVDAVDPLKAHNETMKALQGSQRSKTRTEVWLESFDPSEYNYGHLKKHSQVKPYVTATELHSVFRQWESDHFGRNYVTDLTVWGRQVSKLLPDHPVFIKAIKGKARTSSYLYESPEPEPDTDDNVVPFSDIRR